MPPIEPTRGAGGAAGAGTLLGPGLGKDDFLLLLVTQLRNQDPLNPLQAQDFASQLAEFTALEQQVRTNELLEAQDVREDARLVEARESMSVGLIGRTVITEGNRVELGGDASSQAVHVATAGDAAFRIQLVDDGGRVVHELSAHVVGEGLHRIELGSASGDLASGTYTLRVQPEAGEAVRPLAAHRVRGVRFEANGPVLLAGQTEIALSDVLEITLNQ